MPHPAAAVHGAPHPRSAGSPRLGRPRQLRLLPRTARDGARRRRQRAQPGPGRGGPAAARPAHADRNGGAPGRAGRCGERVPGQGGRTDGREPAVAGGWARARLHDGGRQGDAGVGGPGAGRQHVRAAAQPEHGPHDHRTVHTAPGAQPDPAAPRPRVRAGRGSSWTVRGIGCVGVAVRSADGPVAGISLCGDTRTVQLERVAPLVVDAAREVTRTLHPELGTPRRGRRTPEIPDSSWSTETLDQLLAVQSGQWL